MAFMQDPMVAQLIGQNPQAKQIMASLQAHIAEHLGFNYRKQIEEKLGAPLPPPNEELPEEVEVNLARLVADAGKQITQAHKQEAAQREAQKKAQDPIVQMQQQELKLKAAEVQRKAKKDADDNKLKAAELQRKAMKDKADLQMDQAELSLNAKKEKVKMKDARQANNSKMKMDMLNNMMKNKPENKPKG
jgi:membrane protein involved in colicin uptake